MSPHPEQWQARAGRFVEPPHLDHYAERYADYFAFTRRDGILEMRMHTGGDAVRYSLGLHNAWGQAWREIGADPENEVLIITGTGDHWIHPGDPAGLADMMRPPRPEHFTHGVIYHDAAKLVENFVFGIDIPTIAAVNGPSPGHTEFALLSDITLAAETATFLDPHLLAGTAPGDGLQLTLQELLGTKRAAYHLYTGEPIDARTAEEVGLVNEVLTADRLLPRAWEIATSIRSRPRAARRLTHAIVSRPWKRRLVQDFGYGLAHEMFGISADRVFG
ncbi:enoyl-CoA hydratase/isomerase family protein [Actinoplanes couchii]|uniref:Crotonase n=1 Tax=Actinoplanes couchii TaxID=403638 RepID=A0ABQ3XKD0_9ACTN|nr:enoyl-CoA hydratase/isomerase family protein [Actinoplanes couchii]MDR6320493.1 enoyl-CoA hydratase/carnithine racemase [Actinoplanes couchii]GID58897.1 crotonase [Actinoplanes couchii]